MLNGESAGSGTRPRRLAAIDVGTNSLRLIVVEASPDGSYRLIDDEKAITRWKYQRYLKDYLRTVRSLGYVFDLA